MNRIAEEKTTTMDREIKKGYGNDGQKDTAWY